MLKLCSKNILICSVFALIAIGLCSCGSTKELKYFQDIPDTTKLSYIKLKAFTAPVIHPDEVISVNIYTIDLNATLSVNAVNAAAVATQNAVTGFDQTGYLVDRDGNIDMPELGKIKVANLNIEQAQVVIRQKALKYFNDPIVIVRNKSVKITFLGEFTKQGTFIIPSEKFTIMDALGFSGGLTDFGQRSDVMLVRQNNDTNTLSTIRINLKNTDILKSPYYYLQNNDVLIANPNKSKGISTDQTFNRNITLISLVVSLFTTLFVLIKR